MSCKLRPAPSHLPVAVAILALTAGVLLAQESPAPGSADALFQGAVASLSQGKLPEAEAAFLKIAELEPDRSRGVIGLAEVYSRQNKTDDALRLLQSESRKYPARPDLHYALGNVGFATAHYDLAIAEYQQVLDNVDRSSGTAADLYFRMAEAYRRKNDPEFAIDLLRQAQKIQPGNVSLSAAIGMMLDAAGRPQEAIAEYRQILKTNPDNSLMLNNLAYLLADSDPNLALAYAHRARQLAPSDEPSVADTLGWIYLKMKQTENAIALFRGVVGKVPGRAVFRYHLALALEQSGDHDSARKESEAALKSSPSKDEERQINELLGKIKTR